MSTQHPEQQALNASGQDRVNRLVDSIRLLVHGTHADLGDVRVLAASCDTRPVSIRVTWTLTATELLGSTYPGLNSIPSYHYGYDQASFNAEVAKRRCAATDYLIQNSAAAKLVNRGASSLDGMELLVRDFGAISVNSQCLACHEQGTQICFMCSMGWQTCSRCGGRGSRDVPQWDGHATRYVTEPCGCSAGRVMCTNCHGKGSTTCSQCHGHRGYTQKSHVVVKALPSQRDVSVSDGPAASDVSAFLLSCPVQSLRRLANLAQQAPRIDHTLGDGVTLRYDGAVDVTCATIELHGQHFTLVAIGEDLVPVTHPPLFDHLLAKELASVQGKHRPPARKLKAWFEAMRKLRMPARAMELLAAGKSSSEAIYEASEGYISKDAGATLSVALNQAMDAVSPRYWAFPWIFITVPVTALGLVGGLTALSMPAGGDAERLLLLSAAVVVASVVLVVVAPVAGGLSRMGVSVQRRGLPKSLRQRTASFAPFKAAAVAVLASVLLGAGLVVADAIIGPASPLRPVVVHASRLGADLMERLVPGPASLPNVWALDPIQMTREVQARLIQSGHLSGAVDGKIGPRTRRAMRRYAREHGLPESSGVAEIHAHIGQGNPGN